MTWISWCSEALHTVCIPDEASEQGIFFLAQYVSAPEPPMIISHATPIRPTGPDHLRMTGRMGYPGRM
jgi:hypothetical protein